MATTNYEAFEQWAIARLANGPVAYDDLHAAARLEGFERHLDHLRTMAARGDLRFRLTVVDGQRNHTVELA